MRSLRPALVLLIAAWLLAPPADATRVAARTVACPLGGAPATVYDKLSTDTLGGYDSDLASYASKGQWRAYAVATCPDSLLSLLGADMERAWTPAELDAMRAALKGATSALSTRDAAALPAWERYRIAAAVYKALGWDDLRLADLYLEASWTARDAAVGVYMGLNGPQAARALLDDGKAELEKPLTVAQRKTVLYNLARVAHRGGYAAERDRLLSAFETAGALDKEETEALARFRRIASAVEPALQDQAIAHLRAALSKGSHTPEQRAKARYQLGDLLRRRGKATEARAELSAVAADADAPAELRELAAWLSRDLAG